MELCASRQLLFPAPGGEHAYRSEIPKSKRITHFHYTQLSFPRQPLFAKGAGPSHKSCNSSDGLLLWDAKGVIRTVAENFLGTQRNAALIFSAYSLIIKSSEFV